MTNVRTTIWVVAVALSVASSPVLGWTQFKDGLTHDIDYEINDDVWVDWQTPLMYTTVNMLAGGSITYPYRLQAHEDSIVNMLGDSIVDYLYAFDNSRVDMSGGSIGYDLYADDSSQVDISGGSIEDELFSSGRAILSIHGSDFAVDGVPFGYGELTSILGGSPWDEPNRNLTGTLASGEPINNGFYIGYDAKIVLVPAPAFPGWVWMESGGDFGYSLDEDDLLYFVSFWPVWYYNFTTGLWVEEGPVGWTYVDWPFYYELDTENLMFVLPPEIGLLVYHFSTGQLEVLPRIIP